MKSILALGIKSRIAFPLFYQMSSQETSLEKVMVNVCHVRL